MNTPVLLTRLQNCIFRFNDARRMEHVSGDALICLRLKYRKIDAFHEDLFKFMVDAAQQTCRHEYMPTEKRADWMIMIVL